MSQVRGAPCSRKGMPSSPGWAVQIREGRVDDSVLLTHRPPQSCSRSSRLKLPRPDAPCPSVPHRVTVACLNSVHATCLGPFLGQKVTAGPPSMGLAPGKGASSGSPGGGAQGREGWGRFPSQRALLGLPGTPRPSAPPWKDSSTLTPASSYSSH